MLKYKKPSVCWSLFVLCMENIYPWLVWGKDSDLLGHPIPGGWRCYLVVTVFGQGLVLHLFVSAKTKDFGHNTTHNPLSKQESRNSFPQAATMFENQFHKQLICIFPSLVHWTVKTMTEGGTASCHQHYFVKCQCNCGTVFVWLSTNSSHKNL